MSLVDYRLIAFGQKALTLVIRQPLRGCFLLARVMCWGLDGLSLLPLDGFSHLSFKDASRKVICFIWAYALHT